MKTYFITGGAGFIGSNLTERLLNENHKVVVIDNFCNFYDPKIKEKNVENFLSNNNYWLYRGDIRNINLLEHIFQQNKIDVIIHLAAMAGVRSSIENPILYQEVNVIGTQNVLEVAKKYHVKNLLLASSSSVYGNSTKIPFQEDTVTDFVISPYAASKKANEVMAHVYHKLYQMNIIMLRFFTVYGPRQRPDLAISKFVKLIQENQEIPMYGNGNTARDYTYIDDVIEGIIKAISYVQKNSDVYEVINIGNANPICLTKTIEIMSKELNINPRIKKYPIPPGDVERTFADISKAQKLLGYKPNTSFEEGIHYFVEWYKNK